MAHQGYDNARQRRNDKRKALTAAYNAQHGIVEPVSREVRENAESDTPRKKVCLNSDPFHSERSW
ncbi:hypothetical protein CBW53_21575 [Yersinia frederiksenii]|nr:hypothetical protein CBW53_21575 [Yersinia frederiksenii]CNI29252.1 Uncharacterised protein [Yersinia frederiksenii]